MRILNTETIRGLIAAGIFAMLLALPAYAAGAKTSGKTLIPNIPPIDTYYDVYVGGVHLIEAQIHFEQDKGRYHTVVTAHTQGFWGKMAPWNTVLESSGKIGRDRFVPSEFFTRDEWRSKPKITKLHYGKNGTVVAEFDPPNTDKNREVVTEAQKKGSLDPVTALLQMLANVAVHKSCAVTVPVFEGKRRFDVTGLDRGEDEIDSEDYGMYSGKARACSAEFTMIAGEWKDRAPSKFWQKSETEAGRDPFTIWLAPIGPGGVELPVRLESRSVFGMIIVHLREWKKS